MDKKQEKTGEVISLIKFKEKKVVEENLASGRKPLYVSHLNGKIKGSPNFDRNRSEDFGDRLQRIKASLEKINFLMKELKKISNKEEDEKTTVNPN